MNAPNNIGKFGIVTLADARAEKQARWEAREARWAANARKRGTHGMSDADAQRLASATDPRIGVLLRLGRGHKPFPIFYAWIGDPVHGNTVESRDIADIVRALAALGAN